MRFSEGHSMDLTISMAFVLESALVTALHDLGDDSQHGRFA